MGDQGETSNPTSSQAKAAATRAARLLGKQARGRAGGMAKAANAAAALVAQALPAVAPAPPPLAHGGGGALCGG